MDILLIRFLRKTILPSNTLAPQTTPTHVTSEPGQHSSNRRPMENEFNQTSKCLILDWISGLIKIEGPEKVPIRVSILSSCIIIPNIVANIFIEKLGLSFEQKTYVLWIMLAVANTLRCPLTVILAFKANSKVTESRKKEMTQKVIGGMNLQNEILEETDTF